MPRGVYERKKKDEPVENVPSGTIPEEQPKEQIEENKAVEQPKLDKHDELMESMKQKPVKPVIEKTIPEYDPKLQKLFEAPDGTIIVGEKTAAFALYRMRDGRIMKILPRRASRTPDEIAKEQLKNQKF